MRLVTALAAACLLPAAASALTPEECYQDITTAAELLQICLVNQSVENECVPDEQTLAATTKLCRDAGGKPERMELARQIGADQVVGDPAQSPWSQIVNRRKEAKRLLRVNEDRFRKLFSRYINYTPQILEQSFDTRACPLGFEGNGQAYLLSGISVVRRQGEQPLPQLTLAEEEQTHLYFARMLRGKCYRPDSTVMFPDVRVEPDQPGYVYNLSPAVIGQMPEEGRPIMIDELRKSTADQPYQIGKPLVVKVKHYPTFAQGRVHRHLCDTPLDCLKQRARLLDDYEAYNKALRQKNQATACLIYLDPNRTGEISIDQLYGMDCTAENGKRLLEESGRRISEFGARLFR